MKLKILIVAGDGIGPEVTREAVNVLRSVAEVGGYDFQFTEALIGGVAIRADGARFPAYLAVSQRQRGDVFPADTGV